MTIASLLAFAPRQISQAEGEAERLCSSAILLSRAIPEVRQTRLMPALDALKDGRPAGAQCDHAHQQREREEHDFLCVQPQGELLSK